MTLSELKNFINNGIVPSDFMIFVSKDSDFLVNQYVQELQRLASDSKRVPSIYTAKQTSIAILTSQEDCLNLVYTDTFDERAEDYAQFENTIVICAQVDKSILKSVEKYTINFPKLEEWQIFDYAKTLCPGLEDNDLLWLIKATNNNIERVVNELEKVKLFNKQDQKAVFSAIRFDPQTDLYDTDLFTITDALVDGNTVVLFDILKHENCVKIAPVGLANRVLNKLKTIILVTQNLNVPAAELGISDGYHARIRRSYYNLNIEAVKQKIKFLTNFDLALKTSKLELSDHDMLNYLISHLTYKITV